jgi:hypothetical protein
MNQNSNLTSMMYRIDERPFGKSWDEWATQWWKWFLSIPKDKHPAHDKTGERAHLNQNDPNVWFLAGTTGGSAERTIVIPSDTSVFFPVINITTSYLENPSLKSEEDMSSFINGHMMEIAKKEATIDGEPILISENNRARSPLFQFSFPTNNIFGTHDGETQGIGDGYWIFLKPLHKGTHYIRTSGACMSGKVQIDTTFKLVVE